jgi:hypothetical protein
MTLPNPAETDPFNTGRILSGRVHVKDENFTFSLWGYREASRNELMLHYRSWLATQRKNCSLKNKRIDIAWTG